MVPLDILTLFFATSVLLALAPGPDNIFVLTQSALHGRRAGLLVTLGICTGIALHTTAIALGVAAIFQASAAAFTTLKAAGAAYLLYLAWGAFRSGASTLAPGAAASPDGPGAQALFLRGAIMNATNPKVAIFFLAFLPQFTDPDRGPVALQMAQLGSLFALATLLVFSAIALAAGQLGRWLRHAPRTQVVMNRIAGTIFVGLAAGLVLAER